MRSVDNKTLTEAKAAIQSSYTLSMIMPRHPSLYKDLDFGRNDRYGERVFKMVSTYPFNLKYMHAQKYTIVKMDECRKFTAIMVPIASDGDKGALFITADIDKYGYTNFNEQLFTSDGELLIEKAETVRLKKEQRDLIETVADIMYDVLTKPVLKVKKVATATEKEADRIDEIYRTKGENAANKARVNAEAKELSTWPGVKVYCQATYTPNKRYYMSSDSTKKHARKCYEVLKRVGNQLHSIMDKVDFKDIIIDKSVCAKLICKPILQIGCTSITGQNANIDVDLITKLQLTNKADVLFSTFGEFCWPDNPSEYDLDMVEIYNRRLKALGMTDSEIQKSIDTALPIVRNAYSLIKNFGSNAAQKDKVRRSIYLNYEFSTQFAEQLLHNSNLKLHGVCLPGYMGGKFASVGTASPISIMTTDIFDRPDRILLIVHPSFEADKWTNSVNVKFDDFSVDCSELNTKLIGLIKSNSQLFTPLKTK